VPAPGEWPPFCVEEAEHLSRSASPGTGKPYGMQRVCRVFGLARSTAYYLKAREAVPPEQRPAPRKRGPVGAATDDELVGHIRRVLAESPFTGEGYRKVWARLRHQGIRTASERVRRLMREHHLQAPRRGGHAHGPKAHDGTIVTEEPDTMWGTDMTTTVTTGQGTVHVFVAVDHCTCECVGLHAAKGGNRFEALEPLRQGVREHFGTFEAGVARGLTIRHDHGSNYLSDDFQRELGFLGMASSPSFVREPEGNGCAERFIRTLKEQLLWIRTFATVAELVEALGEFKRTYNERWLIRRHGHRTPSPVRRDLVGSQPAAA
jgi:putative transposase